MVYHYFLSSAKLCFNNYFVVCYCLFLFNTRIVQYIAHVSRVCTLSPLENPRKDLDHCKNTSNAVRHSETFRVECLLKIVQLKQR